MKWWKMGLEDTLKMIEEEGGLTSYEVQEKSQP